MKKSRFSEEQIVRILQEASSGQISQAELCRKHGISQNAFYLWKRKYSGMETDDGTDLSKPPVRNPCNAQRSCNPFSWRFRTHDITSSSLRPQAGEQ
ncbi:MAG: hypothetical protein BGO01_02525 [Armatimonadetes bacterium 55-13]|nr:MAG: hypothetical protein BGO01_02525 [Armatimonadetes bacterium 55-13]